MARFDPASPLVHPLPDPDRVELRAGLVYAKPGGRELAMDLYLPAGRAPGSRCAAPPCATAPSTTWPPARSCRRSWSSGPARTARS